jgi:23S rRNA A2030 N6-methylase RlmJ
MDGYITGGKIEMSTGLLVKPFQLKNKNWWIVDSPDGGRDYFLQKEDADKAAEAINEMLETDYDIGGYDA